MNVLPAACTVATSPINISMGSKNNYTSWNETYCTHNETYKWNETYNTDTRM